VLDSEDKASRIEFGTGYLEFRSHPRAAEALAEEQATVTKNSCSIQDQ